MKRFVFLSDVSPYAYPSSPTAKTHSRHTGAVIMFKKKRVSPEKRRRRRVVVLPHTQHRCTVKTHGNNKKTCASTARTEWTERDGSAEMLERERERERSERHDRSAPKAPSKRVCILNISLSAALWKYQTSSSPAPNNKLVLNLRRSPPNWNFRPLAYSTIYACAAERKSP